ncbi:MAG: armadillo-type protein, partial [Olpidium bornovanus]
RTAEARSARLHQLASFRAGQEAPFASDARCWGRACAMPSLVAPPTRPPVIEQLIEGVDRYNPDNCELLENYLQHQCASREHDLMANLAILKLYQFNPELINITVISNILAKALTAIPQPDFGTCLFMLNDTLMAEEPIGKLVAMRDLLETARYRDFWKFLSSDGVAAKAVAEVTGFENAIREARAVSMTCQSIRRRRLEEYINLSGAGFDTFLSEQGWKLEGDLVQIPINKDNEAKTTVLSENIKFERYSASNI